MTREVNRFSDGSMIELVDLDGSSILSSLRDSLFGIYVASACFWGKELPQSKLLSVVPISSRADTYFIESIKKLVLHHG